MNLSSTEREAICVLMRAGGSMLTSVVPDKNERTVFGDTLPGMGVYKKLEKKGLIFFTEEDPVDDPGSPIHGFIFTNEIYLTDEGKIFASTQNLR